MFNLLSQKFSKTLSFWTGNTYISHDNIVEIIREIRKNLLEADVALPVVKDFIYQIQEKTIGKKINNKLHPSQFFISVVKKELEKILGNENCPLFFNKKKDFNIILVIGSEGSGKTTTVVKLAKFLKKNVMVSSLDIYRHGSIDQLNDLAKIAQIKFLDKSFIKNKKLKDIINISIKFAKSNNINNLIFDTTGITHNNNKMMAELKFIYNYINPNETLLVIDSMIGQDAIISAQAFDNLLNLNGIILTKVDGDHRGGSALSLRYTIKKPIKFIGIGEKLEDFEKFYPERIASRILGMGDVLSLVEDIEKNIKLEDKKNFESKIKNTNFSFQDFKNILLNINKIGGLKSIISKIPMFNNNNNNNNNINNKILKEMIAIIDSMSISEKEKNKKISFKRKRTIAFGSGTSIITINKLLKQYKTMQKVLKLQKNNNPNKNFLSLFNKLQKPLKI